MSKRIAVIDDDPDIVQTIKLTLKTKDYEIFSAPDGEEGLRLVKTEKPDLIILDLMMPKISGLEVCRRLRDDEETRDIPIIILSGIGEKTGKSEDFWQSGLGTEDFIAKPFDPMALLGRVEYVLRRSQYVSTSSGGEESEGAVRVPKPSLKDAVPREVVRCFIEAWNGQNFGEEWNCMAEAMRGSLEVNDYISRRRQTYAAEAAAPRRQILKSVVEENIEDDMARVVADREDTVRDRATGRREQYTLKKTEDGWKITTVRVLPR